MKLLVVDDDRDLVELLDFVLRRAGFTVIAAHDAPTARQTMRTERPDLVVLDINLGRWNGIELIADLRRERDVPVVLLTGRDSEEDKVAGLEAGADDYITKPFAHRELVARIRAMLRRYGRQPQAERPAAERLQVGPVTLDTQTHTASKEGAALNLTVTEFRLLHYLMRHAGTVVPTADMLRHVWGYDDPAGSDVVRVTVFRLRRKLEDDPADPKLIQTVPGVGVLLHRRPEVQPPAVT